MSTKEKPAKSGRKTRRSKRVALHVPVLVYEPGVDHKFIVDDTFAVMVNQHGAMIAIGWDVRSGQKLLVINKRTKESKECRVAYIGPHQADKRCVGVEFLQAAPEFWGIVFPPTRSTLSSKKDAQ